MLVAATPRGAVIKLARNSGRCALASIRAWTEGVPAAATPHGAIFGLARASRRRAPASLRRDACMDGGGDANRGHTSRSHHRARPQRWEERTGSRPHLDKRGTPVAAATRGAVVGLARDGDGSCLGGGGCRSQPHLTEPFSDSPATVGGVHRQPSTPRRRGVGAGRCHTSRNC
jgi:hypothetical protein